MLITPMITEKNFEKRLMFHVSVTVKTRIHILGEISLKVFLSVLNFLLLKKCKEFTNYDEIHNLERKLNFRHTTS